MKTLEEYMNDPRIDPTELEPVRRVHAIRLQMNDQRQTMKPGEFDARLRAECKAYIAEHGLSVRTADFSGAGRLTTAIARYT
ncbi:MAG: hypothetical protein LBU17_01630 [Treponema sp.]|jgi:hypothetical protein|nr:hypothetical protein [Treponema sp.]